MCGTGRELIIEMLLYQTQYLNAIQTMCPHVLRYLATAVVINKSSRRQALRDLVKVIQQENYNYSDPITEFLASLYVDFDFDAAQEKLQLCADVLKNDFFLVACMKDFIDNARLMIFELFCRIHQCISINMLAEKLNMSPPDAERWIVDLIRQAKLDAKIDSQQGHVVMGTQAISPYQQLIEKTKNLSFRTQMLAMNIEKKANTARTNERDSNPGLPARKQIRSPVDQAGDKHYSHHEGSKNVICVMDGKTVLLGMCTNSTYEDKLEFLIPI
ncbi:Proteasome component (PCI) domain [Trinorchestia longiramus]|nr:Proteasome component (PCI) domain [Trinorchestia longiramus]